MLLGFFLSLQGFSQNIFILEKAGGGHLRWYHNGDFINLKTIEGEKIEGRIHFISDTSLIINFTNEVMVSDIEMIYRDRRMFRLLQNLSLIGGVLYLSISGLNGLINNDSPIVPQEILKISGGMIAAAILLTPLTTRQHKIRANRWKVKVLDFTD
jgi:hypothetical protein